MTIRENLIGNVTILIDELNNIVENNEADYVYKDQSYVEELKDVMYNLINNLDEYTDDKYSKDRIKHLKKWLFTFPAWLDYDFKIVAKWFREVVDTLY